MPSELWQFFQLSGAIIEFDWRLSRGPDTKEGMPSVLQGSFRVNLERLVDLNRRFDFLRAEDMEVSWQALFPFSELDDGTMLALSTEDGGVYHVMTNEGTSTQLSLNFDTYLDSLRETGCLDLYESLQCGFIGPNSDLKRDSRLVSWSNWLRG